MLSRYCLNAIRINNLRYFSSHSTIENIKTAKRNKKYNAEVIKTKSNKFNIINETLSKNTVKTTEDWNRVRKEILDCETHITNSNVDAMVVGFFTSTQNYDKALDYINFLKSENIKLNLATIGKYFKLVFLTNKDKTLNTTEEDSVIKAYNQLREAYPILDAVTLENVIEALSITTNWKLCLNMLEEIKISGLPGSPTYSAVVGAAFLNKEDEIGWKLFNELLENNREPTPLVFNSYLKSIEKRSRKKESLLKKLEVLFQFLQKHDFKFKEETMAELINFLKKHDIKANYSKISNRGMCNCCSRNLLKFDPTDSEFNDLKKKIINNVIIGKDVFNKTTPKELDNFKDFISRSEKYDVVVDGLNVAYSVGVKQPPKYFMFLLHSVVQHFKAKGKKILVLGRSHMDTWPRFDVIKKMSSVFLTADVSQDDPYLLYCALNSGQHTIIVTKDLMRSHKFLLKHYHLKLLFNRWLSHHQYQLQYVENNGNVIFRVPPPYTATAQKNENYWHIPYEVVKEKVQRGKFGNDKVKFTNWLCIKC